MKNNFLKKILILMVVCAMLVMTACGGGTESTTEGAQPLEADGSETTAAKSAAGDRTAPDIPGLKFESQMELKYAVAFDVFNYEGGYQLIRVYDDNDYLLVPEGMEEPEGLDGKITVIHKPCNKIYLAASSSMALFDAVNGLDNIKLSGLAQNAWYVENAARAMEEGRVKFAGKYSEPDYELLVNEDCNLAIESTMIYHTPKVKEMIEDLDIPVFVDRSSYETHPLGRTEWVKLYSCFIDKYDAAVAFFNDQASIMEELKDFQSTGKTVAFFYITTDNQANVRRPGDYIPEMIKLAGGVYVPEVVAGMEDTKRMSISISLEQFYADCIDADYLIYNASIDSPINSVDDLIAKSELFKDFKAVKEGNVWSTGKDLYQATDTVGNLIGDIHIMLTTADESQMKFIHKVN